MPRHRRTVRRSPLRAVLALTLLAALLVPAGSGGAGTPANAGPAPTAAAAAAVRSPAQAVQEGVLSAAANSVTQYVSVVDRTTGQLVARTGNADEQVASESIMKMYLAAYYLVLHGGYRSTPQATLDRLASMIRFSDDPIASQLFTASAIPTIAQRYGMGSTINATDRVGHWGAARITATDVTTFLWRASQDPAVGPWLMPVLAQTNPTGSDGFDQTYGLQALGGVKGSKQGWGGDSFWTAHRYAVHSVGYTDRWLVAVLSLAPTYPDPARSTLTTTAALVQSAVLGPPADGTFVHEVATGRVYRIAGGAPVYVSDWAVFGGMQPLLALGPAEFAALPSVPRDGTFIAAGGRAYRIAGGAPTYISSWAPFGGPQPYVAVDPLAVALAGNGDVWSHLRLRPADGTFIAAGGRAYRIAGGAPTYVSSWAPFGGPQPYTVIDPTAVGMAGNGDVWRHLLLQPADGTFVAAAGSAYRIVGGAATYVSSWGPFGGPQPYTVIDPTAVGMAGNGDVWKHLALHPADGTFLAAGGHGYRMAGGAPIYLSSWAPFGVQPYTVVDPAALSMAGNPGVWKAFRAFPLEGTRLRAAESGATYRVANGVPVPVPGLTGTVAVSRLSIDNAGGPPPFHFLRR